MIWDTPLISCYWFLDTRLNVNNEPTANKIAATVVTNVVLDCPVSGNAFAWDCSGVLLWVASLLFVACVCWSFCWVFTVLSVAFSDWLLFWVATLLSVACCWSLLFELSKSYLPNL